MNNMVNIAEILKNAPQRLKLYSLVHDEVTLEKVIDSNDTIYPIVVFNSCDDCETFTKYGKIFNNYDNAECVLFPSKEHRSWENWQEVLFQVGDIIICEVVNISENQQNVCCIYNGYNKHYNDYAGYFYCHEGITTENLNKQILLKNARYATPEEREQFMVELNANGYKWNADTKQIEKIKQQYTPNSDCNGYEDTITKEEPFTIDDFKPFDKVLVRDTNSESWYCNLFSHFNKNASYGKYEGVFGNWIQCIPYNDETKHLLGTTDDCPNKYKTW